MKIYTKTGDKGQTSLVGGKRISKSNIQIAAYGTIDELNSHIGLLRDSIKEKRSIDHLTKIQNTLFVIGSRLASEEGRIPDYLSEIEKNDIESIEKEIDWLNTQIEPLKNFILPGGHPVVSYAHISRCVCRRAERIIVKLSEIDTVEENIIIYLNRLSDYLFTLARKIGKDFGINEIEWKSR